MTTAIVAATFLEAREAATALGLKGQAWLYPNHPDEMRGHRIVRTIYVDGWTLASMSVAALEEMRYRQASDAVELNVESLIPDRLLRAQIATALLATDRRRLHPSATGIDLSGTGRRYRQLTRLERLGFWIRGLFA